MPRLVEWSLAATALGVLLCIPCVLQTTPLTMVLFFYTSLPLFVLGFVLYVVALIQDLRSHKVL